MRKLLDPVSNHHHNGTMTERVRELVCQTSKEDLPGMGNHQMGRDGHTKYVSVETANVGQVFIFQRERAWLRKSIGDLPCVFPSRVGCSAVAFLFTPQLLRRLVVSTQPHHCERS